MSGAYIGVDVGSSTKARDSFAGLEVPPVLTAHREGRLFSLRARDLGSLSYGTPVYFRRIEVGELVAYQLDRDGSGITAQVFVHAPYDQYVTPETRFWHASGLDIWLDAAGVKMHTQSLSSVLLEALRLVMAASRSHRRRLTTQASCWLIHVKRPSSPTRA